MTDAHEPIEKLYVRHKGLIGSLIRSIVINNKSVVSVADLHQVGALALVVALKTYDPSLGTLSNYIRRCIRNALLEEANSFSGVFTVDEKIRRLANKVFSMMRDGKSEQDIMSALGIGTRATYLSLVNLVDNKTVDLEQIEHIASNSLDESGLLKTLDDMGLMPVEKQIVTLLLSQTSPEQIELQTGLTKSQIATVKLVVKDKITNWGKS